MGSNKEIFCWCLLSLGVSAAVGAMAGSMGSAMLDHDITASTRATAFGAFLLNLSLPILGILMMCMLDTCATACGHRHIAERLGKLLLPSETLFFFFQLPALYMADITAAGVVGHFLEKLTDKRVLSLMDQVKSSASGAPVAALSVGAFVGIVYCAGSIFEGLAERKQEQNKEKAQKAALLIADLKEELRIEVRQEIIKELQEGTYQLLLPQPGV